MHLCVNVEWRNVVVGGGQSQRANSVRSTDFSRTDSADSLVTFAVELTSLVRVQAISILNADAFQFRRWTRQSRTTAGIDDRSREMLSRDDCDDRTGQRRETVVCFEV